MSIKEKPVAPLEIEALIQLRAQMLIEFASIYGYNVEIVPAAGSPLAMGNYEAPKVTVWPVRNKG